MSLNYNPTKTIYSVSTGKIDGAISVIRISGEDSFKLLKYCSNLKNNNIFLTTITYKNKIIDQVVINKYNNPKSYTGEDTLEIICHANKIIVADFFKLFNDLGFRHSLPGEFTKRAYINGKIDLLKAESINKLISTNSPLIKQQSLNNVLNYSSNIINKIKDQLVEVIGFVEVNIDYPEYFEENKKTKQELLKLFKGIKKIFIFSLKNFQVYNDINSKKTICIVGKPNVGKSTLFNSIINYERSTVSNIPGTTRDYIEKSIYFQDEEINIIDTAGIRKNTGKIESINIKKTLNIIQKADLVIALFTNPNTIKNDWVFNHLVKKNKNIEVFINKGDLKKNKNPKYRYISAKQNKISPVIKCIKKIADNKNIIDYNQIVFYSARDKSLIDDSIKNINIAIDLLLKNELIEIIVIHLKKIFNNMNYILGIETPDDLIDNIFNKFCLGK